MLDSYKSCSFELLLGLYVSHLGTTFGAETIAHVLRELDRQSIGEFAVSNPKKGNHDIGNMSLGCV